MTTERYQATNLRKETIDKNSRMQGLSGLLSKLIFRSLLPLELKTFMIYVYSIQACSRVDRVAMC
ncbi:hypothetical protein K443DRAFT_673517 [Laccaria amethystina LaAM-08-1]|uniref:Uncharacterized protein n=1 Tax=Laccaria amethystina LaAM-08-1 TaxID=1095629 RepID=A0A0C9YGV0_9AGAR|nr:hypothetical protein K443DRAFT_673517 [Laccaria amethystina LaAM-08-1]